MEIIRYYVTFCDLSIIAAMVLCTFNFASSKVERNTSLGAILFLIANVLLIWR